MRKLTADEQHWDDNATGEVGSSRVTGEDEVDDEHDDHGGVGELVVGVLGVEVVHRLLPSSVEQGGGLTEGAVSQYFPKCSVFSEGGNVVFFQEASVELDVDLCVGLIGVCCEADILVFAVRVPSGVGAGHGGAA